jgi:hypothetical protein
MGEVMRDRKAYHLAPRPVWVCVQCGGPIEGQLYLLDDEPHHGACIPNDLK